MDRIYRFRIGVVVAMILLMAVVFTGRLFGLQLTPDEEGVYNSSNTTTYTQTVSAARGEILDRHGTVLVRNRATYSVTINSFALFKCILFKLLKAYLAVDYVLADACSP